ncbi:hypothetical protein ABPG77_007057 [Micractinium sp. CCAP 211/92]
MSKETVNIHRIFITKEREGCSACLAFLCNAGGDNVEKVFEVTHTANVPLTITVKKGKRVLETLTVAPGASHAARLGEPHILDDPAALIESYSYEDGRPLTVSPLKTSRVKEGEEKSVMHAA